MNCEKTASNLCIFLRTRSYFSVKIMAEALPEAERSLWGAQDGDDDEVTLMVRKMKYEEVKGKRGGTFYHTPNDDHLYR